MSAIDDFANEPEFQDELADSTQGLPDDRPIKKKSNLPLIGAGVAMAVAFSFVAYTKFIKADAMPAAMMPPVAEQMQATPLTGLQEPQFVPNVAPAIGMNPAQLAQPELAFDATQVVPQQPAFQSQFQPAQPPAYQPALEPALELAPQVPASAAAMPVPASTLLGNPSVAQGVAAAPSAELSALNEQVVSAHEKIASLEDKLDTLQASIDALLTKIDTIEKRTPVVKKAAPAPSKPAAQAAKPRPAKKSVAAVAVAEKYTVYAMRADRVWVRTASGKTMNFGKGETIPGAGRVVDIDLDKRMVELSSGARLVTN